MQTTKTADCKTTTTINTSRKIMVDHTDNTNQNNDNFIPCIINSNGNYGVDTTSQPPNTIAVDPAVTSTSISNSSSMIHFPIRPLPVMNLYYSMEYERLYGDQNLKGTNKNKKNRNSNEQQQENNDKYEYKMEQVQEYVELRQSNCHIFTNDSTTGNNNTDNTIESISKEVDTVYDDDNVDADDRHRTHREKKEIDKQRRRQDDLNEQYERINRRNFIFQRWNCLSYNERKIFHTCAINEKHLYNQQYVLWVQQNPNHNNTASKDVKCRQQKHTGTIDRNDKGTTRTGSTNDDIEECIADDDNDLVQRTFFDTTSTASPEKNSLSLTNIHAKRRKLPVSNLESYPNLHSSSPGSTADTKDNGIKSRSDFTDFTTSTSNRREHSTGSNSIGATSTTSTATTLLRTNTTTATGSVDAGNVWGHPTQQPFQVQRPAYNKNVTRMDPTSIMTMEDQLHQRETIQIKLQKRIEYLQQELAMLQHRYDTENHNLDCFRRQLHQSIMLTSSSMTATHNVGAAATSTRTENAWTPYHRRTDALDISANRHRQHTAMENHFLPVTALPENHHHQRQVRAAAAVPATPVNQRQRERKPYHSSTKKKTVGGDDACRKSQSKR